ncbi:TldD/PmbA family protein [Tissierella pigra]|uniref:TldD/PmbA family protein n=1 Tax=Tissierella pigra TaxID=2607614 RepID=A0A6N7XQS8_9FIRM|nr:TldD/PmbA family protein [Tissierella pigra]MSU00097.1 TldD/PmbA family protein [Tissierella pigra]
MNLINLLFEKGKEYNIEEMEVYINKNSSVDFNIYEGELEKYIVAEETGLSLRGIYNGKMGYSYTEKLWEENLDELIKNLIQYAENNHSETVEKIASLAGEKSEFIPRKNLLNKYTEEEKINYLLDLEKRAYAVDKRVKTISGCSYSESTNSVYIRNTKGLELESSHAIGMMNLGAVAEEGKNMQTGYSHIVFNDLKEEYKDILIKDSVGDALSMLGSDQAESSNYNIILRNNVAADMFSNFLPIFFGNTVQKGLSLMKGKIDTEVAVESFSIVEDPLMDNGKYYRTFDDEGTLTSEKYIIENGVLKTFLYSNKTAEKDEVSSTGNGFRNSHKSSIDTMSTNMYIKEGNKTLEDMVKEMENGIIITDIDGLHAGINPTSGNFSLLSKGLLVEDGEITRPISQITMAGNLYEMLKNIKIIGNDTKFSHPSSNYFGSPSIYVGKLTIAGK